MRLVVVSHKPCWHSTQSLSGIATDGGFPFQMAALSELFDETILLVPISDKGSQEGEQIIFGHQLTIAPLTPPWGKKIWRKLLFPFWFLINSPTILRFTLLADAVHTPIPGDIGTVGMLLAIFLQKPLFVRHCGNWFVQTTLAERFWKWFMEKFAGEKNVMLATGGNSNHPSRKNPNIKWIFSTSLSEQELISYGHIRELPTIPRLIIVCRQEVEKGTIIVLEALPQLFDRYPKIQLDVVGEGSYLPILKQVAEDLTISQNVNFHGKVNHEEVMLLLQGADIFCYPTAASEGFPKVVLEALASGLPVITTAISVLPQLISQGGGILLKDRTPKELALTILACLKDEVRYCAMSKKAIDTAKQYSLEHWRDQIGAHLQAAWGISLKTND